ncbi:MAG TPA: hypothetical protein VN577_20055 [Terriglobales bacterium]|nr:hypothetical protein [Clostridia bacterium]HWR17134.1 hypothetical protein [Terriglobales bacterium]
MTFGHFDTPERRQGAKNTLLAASTAGVGGLLGVGVHSILRDRPELLVQLISGFGPMFLIVMGFMFLVDKHASRFIETQKESAIATQRMATAIEVIAKRDSERDREMEILTGSLARDTQSVLEKLGRIEDRLNEPRTQAHHAG